MPRAFDCHPEGRFLRREGRVVCHAIIAPWARLLNTWLDRYTFEPKPNLKESLTHAAHLTRIPRVPCPVERIFNRIFGFFVGLGLGFPYNYPPASFNVGQETRNPQSLSRHFPPRSPPLFPGPGRIPARSLRETDRKLSRLRTPARVICRHLSQIIPARQRQKDHLSVHIPHIPTPAISDISQTAHR